MGSWFTIHAKERAYQRYGVVFSKKQWQDFGRTLDNPKYAIRLHDGRLACYFAGRWYLLVRKKNGAVLTFLSPEDATDDDKYLLRGNERYRQINNDAFRVWSNSKSNINTPMLGLPSSTMNTLTLPMNDELPEEILQLAEALLARLCDDKKTT